MDDYTMPLEEANKLRIVSSEPIESSLTFMHEGVEIGRLTWDKQGMRFTGNADAAAHVFFDALARKFGEAKD